MLASMTAFVTCFSQQCLAPVGCSTERIGCTEPRPCLAQPKEFCVVTRRVPQAHGTPLASFPRPRQGTENFPQGHYRTFSRTCCHWLASSEKQLSLHFMLCFPTGKAQILQGSPRSQKPEFLHLFQENQASWFPPHLCMLPALQHNSQPLLHAASPTEPEPCSPTPGLRPESGSDGSTPRPRWPRPCAAVEAAGTTTGFLF